MSRANQWGPGKLVGREGDDLVLEYFDTPGQEPQERHRETVPRASLSRFALPVELRVFWAAGGRWRSGRVINVTGHREIQVRGHEWEGYLKEKDLYVRWDRPLDDPVGFAGAGLLESPLLADKRRPFLQSILAQRAAAHGMRGALSSSIELHKHQIETAWRILQDPVQRYLLADEVGLGKTIEAGLVIRELMLENPGLSVQLILPPFLVGQWRRELQNKFHTADFPGAWIRFSRDDTPETWQAADLVVVDEAHNLARLADHDQEQLSARYRRLAEIAEESPRLLLLSATPALNNEQMFLALLKLLDPALYRHTTTADLRQRMQDRSGLGRLFLGLRPGVPGILLNKRLAELDAAFPGDPEVCGLIAQATLAISGQDQDALGEAINSLRTHVSDAYRVHRRMLRTRRTTALEGAYRLTGRGRPASVFLGKDILTETTRLLENWRQQAWAACETDEEARREAASALAKAVSLCLDPDALRQWARNRPAATPGEREALDQIDSDLRFIDRKSSISRPLADELTYLFTASERPVVFCPTPHMATELAGELQDLLPGRVLTHVTGAPPDLTEQAVRSFEQTQQACVLVADASAEEGRNFQFADLLVHVGLPTTANRLEQRIGRCDRWDAHRDGHTWRSCQVVQQGDTCSFTAAWAQILTDGFSIFDKSVASLQHAVEAATETAWDLLFTQGPGAAAEAVTAVRQILQDETERVREQDALDSLEAPADERSVYGRMTAFEDQEVGFATLCDALFSSRGGPGNLQFEPAGDPVRATGSYELFKQSGHGQAQIPLIPTARLQRDFLPLARQQGTFRRDVAVDKEGLHLYRYGDRFIDAVCDFLWNDDRGRAFGMWRWLPQWTRTERLAYRFDYAVEADPLKACGADGTDPLTRMLADVLLLDDPSLKRRADGMFPPLIATVWLDQDGTPLTDARHLQALQAPYSKPVAAEQGGDYALNRKRIERVYDMIPAGRWAHAWRTAESSARRAVLGQHTVAEAQATAVATAKADLAKRLRQLHLRAARAADNERDFLTREVHNESMASQALVQAMETLSLRLDSTGVVVVSGRPIEQEGQGQG
ncbi:protein DpdE [Streptomyces termitum]|uniref:protein DpdE n=1 Tax=Streptomyces termitum TaxID=67368 RepID=UPI0033AE73AE